jgi:hypothetical protein
VAKIVKFFYQLALLNRLANFQASSHHWHKIQSASSNYKTFWSGPNEVKGIASGKSQGVAGRWLQYPSLGRVDDIGERDTIGVFMAGHLQSDVITNFKFTDMPEEGVSMSHQSDISRLPR